MSEKMKRPGAEKAIRVNAEMCEKYLFVCRTEYAERVRDEMRCFISNHRQGNR